MKHHQQQQQYENYYSYHPNTTTTSPYSSNQPVPTCIYVKENPKKRVQKKRLQQHQLQRDVRTPSPTTTPTAMATWVGMSSPPWDHRHTTSQGYNNNNSMYPSPSHSHSPPPTMTLMRNVNTSMHKISPSSSSSSSSKVRAPEDYVALDCEMVGVGPGGKRSVLARVSIVDYNGQCIFDTFVRVEEKVTDYRTFVSGIREKDLVSPHAMDFGMCRQHVMNVLRNKVLVGHGLQNDLNVLHLTHPWYNIRDTSLYEPFMQQTTNPYNNYNYGDGVSVLRPRRLRDLARVYLGVSIQQQGQEHDSLVDARAAMLLYKEVQSEWDCWVTKTCTNTPNNSSISNPQSPPYQFVPQL